MIHQQDSARNLVKLLNYYVVDVVVDDGISLAKK
jgi:hypothetical protein